MKILIIRLCPTKITINNYNEQQIGLAKALIRQGHICDIVSYNGKDKDEIRNIELQEGKKIRNYCLKGRNILKNGFLSKRLYDIIKNYDVIQIEEYDQLQNIKIVKNSDKPIVLYHGPYYNKFNKYNFKYNLKCKVYDLLFIRDKKYKNIKVMTKSKLAAEFLQKKGFKDVSTIGVGLDNDKFKNINNSIKNEFILNLKKNKNEHTKYLLYLGKLEERRNIKFIIDLLKRLNEINKDIKLIIVGNGQRKYVKKIFNYAKKLNVFDDIYYTQKIDQKEVAQLYNISDIFLLPSGYEIFGMVLLEAMYFGLPVITTFNGGSSTLIENGSNGFICEANKLEDWEKIILELINNEEKYNKISKNAIETIKNNFTWDKIANKFIETYKTLYKSNERTE